MAPAAAGAKKQKKKWSKGKGEDYRLTRIDASMIG